MCKPPTFLMWTTLAQSMHLLTTRSTLRTRIQTIYNTDCLNFEGRTVLSTWRQLMPGCRAPPPPPPPTHPPPTPPHTRSS